MPGVIVGMDGSDGARRALRWAVDEARLRGASLTVLAVVAVPITLGRAPVVGQPEPVDLQLAEGAAKEDVAALDTDGMDVEVRVVAGVPAEVLVDAGADADLLVVGSRGVGGFSRLLLGSVSSQVVQHARCPVAVIPHERG